MIQGQIFDKFSSFFKDNILHHYKSECFWFYTVGLLLCNLIRFKSGFNHMDHTKQEFE